MLFLVVGTPWKRPRSSRLCFPDRGDGWCGGRSPPEQQRYECDCEILVGASRAPPRLPWRNVHASSFTTAISRSALTRVAVVGRVVVIIVAIFFAVIVALVFLFVFFLVCSCRRRTSAATGRSEGSSRGIQDVFCSCPMVRPRLLAISHESGTRSRSRGARSLCSLITRDYSSVLLVRMHVSGSQITVVPASDSVSRCGVCLPYDSRSAD